MTLIPILNHNRLFGYDPLRHLLASEVQITESQITDLQTYALASDVRGHIQDTGIHFTQANISITESQISDLQTYALTTDLSNYIPYDTDVDLGDYDLTASAVTSLELNLVDNLTTPTANYKWLYGYASGVTGAKNILGLQQQIDETQFRLRCFTWDGDGTDNCIIEMFGYGLPLNQTDRHRLQLGWDSTGFYTISVAYSGTQTAKPIKLSANYTTYPNQFYIDVDNQIGIGTNVPAYTFDVVGDIHASANLYLGSNYLNVVTGISEQTVTYYGGMLFTLSAGVFDVLRLSTDAVTIGAPSWPVNQITYGSIEAAATSGFKLGSNATMKYDTTSASIEFNVV